MYNVLLPAYYYITVVLHIHKNCTFLGSAHCFMNTCDTTAAMDRVPFPFAIALWYGTVWLRSKVPRAFV